MSENAAPPENAPPLLDRADELMSDLKHATPKALEEFDEEAIHKARVATRRLTAVSGLFKPLASKRHRKAFERGLHKLRRLLGDLRDLDVMTNHLKALADDSRSAPATERLIDHLRHQRHALRERLAHKKPTGKLLTRLNCWHDLRSEICELGPAIDSLIGQQLHEQLSTFAQRATSLKDPAAGKEVDPHQLRIAGKQLRYTLELATVQSGAIDDKVVRAFKKMQEELGQWHDHLVLGTAAADLAKTLLQHEHDALAAAAQHQLAARFLKTAAKRLNNFSSLWARQGQKIAKTIGESFPLTRDLSETQKDPDPPSSPEIQPPASPQPVSASDVPA